MKNEQPSCSPTLHISEQVKEVAALPGQVNRTKIMLKSKLHTIQNFFLIVDKVLVEVPSYKPRS